MTHTFSIKAIATVALLSALTLLAFYFYPQYRIEADSAFDTADEGFSDWERSGVDRVFSITDDTAAITLDRPGYNARLIRTVEPPFSEGPVRLQAEISATNLVRGYENWHMGALVLVREDDNGKRLGSYTLFPLHGTHDWRRVEAFVDIPSPTPRLSVVARMLESQGRFAIRHVTLTPAIPQRWFPHMRATLIALWSIAGIGIVAGLIRRHSITPALLTLGLIATLTLAGTLMPKENVVGLDNGISAYLPDGTVETLGAVIESVLPGYLNDSSQSLSKFGHWFAFFGLTFAALLMLRGTPVWLVLLGGLTAACATEVLQLMTAARTPHVMDVLIDASGMLTGLILALPLRWLIRRRSQTSESNLSQH